MAQLAPFSLPSRRRHCALVLMVFFVPVLAACGGNAQAPLEGKREQVVAIDVTFQPDPSLVDIDLTIPTPQEQEDWQQANSNARNMMPHMALPERVTEAWKKDVMGNISRHEAVVNPPVVAEGRLFVITPESRVLAFDAWNGDVLWQSDLRSEKDKRTGLDVAGGLGVAHGNVFVSTSGGQVYALDAQTGDPLWRAEVGASIRAAPTIVDERVFVVSHDNRLHVLDSNSGQLLWNHSGIEEALAMISSAAPAAALGRVAVPYSSGEIYVLKASDGRYFWHDVLALTSGLDPLVNINDIVGAPVIADNTLYVANNGGQMAALNLENGQEIWRRDYSATGTPVVAGNAVYVLTATNQMLGLDRDSGKVKWVMNLGRSSLDRSDKKVRWFGPVLAGERLIAISSDGYGVSVSPQDGQEIALRKLADDVSVPPIVANGMLYFLTDEGELLAYD